MVKNDNAAMMTTKIPLIPSATSTSPRENPAVARDFKSLIDILLQSVSPDQSAHLACPCDVPGPPANVDCRHFDGVGILRASHRSAGKDQSAGISNAAIVVGPHFIIIICESN